MHQLNDNQHRTLRAFCDTIHPPREQRVGDNDPFALSATELGVSDLVERALLERDELTLSQLRFLLDLLDRSVVNGVLAGYWGPFYSLSLQQRTRILRSLAHSPFNALRASFHGVKQLVSFLAYTVPRSSEANPFWQVFEYQGRASAAVDASDALPVVTIDRSQTLTCDVLVIGSGAGGGVVAAELAAAGKSVIVAEKGKYFSNAQLPTTEIDGMRRLYEDRGSLRTADRSVIVLAGSTLGGGTTVNWMTCLAPPPELRQQWADEYGFHAALSEEFERSVRIVSNRIGSNADESVANFQNDVIQRGCEALGYSVAVIERNVRNCVKCDFCSFGCRYGAKQDTRRTFLRDAVDLDARILVRAHVNRVRHSGGRVTGAELEVVGPDERSYLVNVNCRAVVVAAGAIHSPALLMRSGLRNKNIGANLFLHPTGAIFASYDEPVNSWEGAPQTRLCDEFSNLDGKGYGVRIEASPAHPGLWALGLPWQSGEQHRFLMQQLPQLANSVVLTRDRYPGRVEVASDGKPVMHYHLHSYDARHFMFGIEQALRIHRAAAPILSTAPTTTAWASTAIPRMTSNSTFRKRIAWARDPITSVCSALIRCRHVASPVPVPKVSLRLKGNRTKSKTCSLPTAVPCPRQPASIP